MHHPVTQGPNSFERRRHPMLSENVSNKRDEAGFLYRAKVISANFNKFGQFNTVQESRKLSCSV